LNDYIDVKTERKAVFKKTLLFSLADSLTPHPHPLPRGERGKRENSPHGGEGKDGEIALEKDFTF
jgi:hypothetical protein